MKNARIKKIYFVGALCCISIAIASLIIYALNQNINLFYTPSQIAYTDIPMKSRIRVGGMVEKGSLIKHDGLKVEFIITDFQERVKVEYHGILPDLFREGQGVVALGHLTSEKTFLANQILAKHDENYMPPELGDSIKKPVQRVQNSTENSMVSH